MGSVLAERRRKRPYGKEIRWKEEGEAA